MFKFSVTPTKNKKQKPENGVELGFGQYFTDYMFIMEYADGSWDEGKIVPYGPIELDPSASCFHYGQEVFEGLKAYRSVSNEILLFRPIENFKRLNASNERMCIPQIDVERCIDAVKQLVMLEKDWIPSGDGMSLYIRPFIIGCDPVLGVHPAHHYKFIIILSPVGAYYPEGLDPVKIYVEDKYVRTVRGGTGTAKTGGNYAASLKAQDEAKGFTQVLWLDGVENRYVEEVGSMNVFFVIDGEVVTPSLNGSVLSGITRKTCIELLNLWGYKVVERRIAIDEIIEAANNGKLQEMFGTGTAAVVSPVGLLQYKGKDIIINNNKIGDTTRRLYDELTAIQWGKAEDKLGYIVKCD